MGFCVRSVRATPASCTRKGPCCVSARARTVVVRAGLGELFAPIIKIFAPPQDDHPSGAGNPFTGKIKHHDGKRPFADNFVAGGQKYSAAADNAAAVSAEAAAEGEPGAADYVMGALERVVGHNFTGDDTEPNTGTGQAGWKGDIHDRKTDGFHKRRV